MGTRAGPLQLPQTTCEQDMGTWSSLNPTTNNSPADKQWPAPGLTMCTEERLSTTRGQLPGPTPLAPPVGLVLFQLQMIKETAQGHPASSTAACRCVSPGKCLALSGPEGPSRGPFLAVAVPTNSLNDFLLNFHVFERFFDKLFIFEICNIYDF